MKTILFSKRLIDNKYSPYFSINNAPDLPLFGRLRYQPTYEVKDSGLCGQQVCRIKSIKHTTEISNFEEINILRITS
jgi:hypothetical protein